MPDADPTAGHDWLGHPHVRLLRDIATAVVRLAEVDRLDSFTLPYPPQAQRALDAVVLECLRSEARSPASLPDLLHWCRTRRISSWPLDGLADGTFGAQDRLIDKESGEPTQLCYELAVERRGDSAALQYDRLVIREAMRACQEMSSPESYTAFRRLLVTRPVLTEAEWFDLSTDLYLDPVRFLLNEIYAPAPDSHRRQGAYVTCARCQTLLAPLAEGGWWCEQDRCRRLGAPPQGRVLDASEVGEVRQLRRPLRQFVTGPGQAEIALEQDLRGLGLEVEMWPGFDAYDLRVVFPDRNVWAIDVKDWAHPGLLGRAAEAVLPEPDYDEACWVVPQFRVDARHDYLKVYERERGDRASGLRLLTDKQLTDAAAARMRGERGPAARIAPLASAPNGARHA